MTKHTGLAAALAVLAAACSGAGMGAAVRKDIASTMASAQGDLSTCYQAALQRKRKARGRVVVAFEAAARSGQFGKVRVVKDRLGDPALTACVIAEVSALKLSRPQSTVVAVDSYPIDFAPSE